MTAFDARAVLARNEAYRATVRDAPVVEHGSESARVRALPRATPAPDLTERYRTPTGQFTLRAIQSAALHQLEQAGGLIGPIGVGGGKGPLCMMAPHAVGARRPLLLLPANLVETFHLEYRKFSPHFKLAKHMRVMTYSALSVASGADFLNQYQPDFIIGDEAHNLRHPESTRTKRLLRYAHSHPETKHMYVSGTLTKRGLKDYAHLAELALGQGAPLPLNLDELLAWANVLDADGTPGEGDWGVFHRCFPGVHTQEAARPVYMDRFRSSPGVVASDESDLGVGLYFHERPLEEPPEVREARIALRNTWCRPDGEELVTALDVFRVESQMSSGFYYVWDWPGGVVDEEWMKARSTWHKAVRALLKRNDPAHDSPFRVALGLARGTLLAPSAKEAYEGWLAVKDRKQPPTKAVWLSDFLVRWTGEWAVERLGTKGGGPAVVWYEWQALGAALAELGLPVFGPGRDPQSSKDAVVACSITAHGTGKNLQRFARALVLNWPSSGTVAEQLIGRHHRPGQLADAVEVEYPAHTPQARQALRQSHTDAQYIEATLGTRQKCNYGTWTENTWQGEEE